MNVLVTGGAGFIGSHLVHWLVEQGHQVRVLDNLSTGRYERLNLVSNHISFIQDDICNRHAIEAAMDSIDLVFHLAALVSVEQSIQQPHVAQEVNATGSLNVCVAARSAGVRRVVQMSSCAVYGNTVQPIIRETDPVQPLSPYATTKFAAEQWGQLYTRLHGLEVVALRCFNVYGPRQDADSAYAAVVPRFITAFREGQPPTIYGDGQQSRDFVYVGDVVQALWCAATVPGIAGEVFNVGRGESRTIRELAEFIAELMTSPVQPQFAPARSGEVRHSCADTRCVAERAGFRAEIELREGLRRTLAHWDAE